MGASNDIALTVEQEDEDRYYWVLVKALEDGESDAMLYGPVARATRAQATYFNALALGAEALRKMMAKR